jgi:hypothetical protein
MSMSMYQSTITRLLKEIADLRKRLGEEHSKQSRLTNDIASIDRSLRNTSPSMIDSKLRDRARKQDEYGRSITRVAEYETKISYKTDEMNRNIASLERLKEQDQKKQEAETKRRTDEQKKRADEQKRRDEEALKREREITREREKQSRLHAQMRMSSFTIDLTKLPTKIKVLFLAANPTQGGISSLSLDEEIRLIQEKLRASDFRDSVELKSRWAVRSTDLLQALNEEKPHVIHFSGHGTDTDEIVFVGPNGAPTFVSKDAIVQLMLTMADNINVVVFNTCFSTGQAEAITKYIDVAIGMNDSIGDEAARVFAAQFYSAIGFGRSVRNAFDQAKLQLVLQGIAEDNTPQLYVREGIDADEIILVRP